MNRIDRIALLVAAMLSGQSAPSDQMVDQAILLATVAIDKLEAQERQ